MLVTTYLFENIHDGKLRERSEVYIVKDKKLLVGIGFHGKRPSLPGGGIEGNEKPETAAERETLEEVGVKIKIIKKLKPYSFDYTKEYGPWKTLPYEITRWNEIGMKCYPFLADFVKEDKSLFNSENDGRKYKWMTSKEAIKAFTDLMHKEQWNDIRFKCIIDLIKQLKKDNIIQ